jgi:hypothetical protein
LEAVEELTSTTTNTGPAPRPNNFDQHSWTSRNDPTERALEQALTDRLQDTWLNSARVSRSSAASTGSPSTASTSMSTCCLAPAVAFVYPH